MSFDLQLKTPIYGHRMVRQLTADATIKYATSRWWDNESVLKELECEWAFNNMSDEEARSRRDTWNLFIFANSISYLTPYLPAQTFALSFALLLFLLRSRQVF